MSDNFTLSDMRGGARDQGSDTLASVLVLRLHGHSGWFRPFVSVWCLDLRAGFCGGEMTDDLVQRLREIVAYFGDANVIREAADRIERLEAALRQIADLRYEEASFRMAYIASRALEGKPTE